MYKNFNLIDFHEYGTEKSKLAEILQICRKTVHLYHDIAMKFCSDFSEDYPILKGKRYTAVKLTDYQCWVIWRIYILLHIRKTPNKLLVESLHESFDFNNSFSKEAFDEYQQTQTIYKKEKDNEYQTTITRIENYSNQVTLCR